VWGQSARLIERVAYGYGFEVLPLLQMPTTDLTISDTKAIELRPVKPVSLSLGPDIDGVVLPKPNMNDPSMMIASLIKRIGADLPVPNSDLLDRFTKFVELLLFDVDPLIDVDLFDFEGWLESRPDYTLKEKEKFRQMRRILDDEIDDCTPTARLTWLTQFIKDEPYSEFKFNRGIFPRTDWAKILFGPMIHSVEKVLFSSSSLAPAFIKKISVCDRPNYILSMFNVDEPVYAADYTGFEGSFRPILMQCCENLLLTHMVKGTHFEQLMHTFVSMTNSLNIIDSRVGVMSTIEGRRMSGEMTTSLCNGFTNLAVILFMAHEQGIDYRDVKVVVEGDDSLFQHKDLKPNVQFYRDLGFSIKLDYHQHLNTASFCGLIFDLNDRANICDSIKAIVKFGWCSALYCGASKKVKLGLIRAKALSYASQCPNSPIISVWAHKMMQLTSGRNLRHSAIHHDKWRSIDTIRGEKLQLWKLPPVIGDGSRQVYADKFHISRECQLAIEHEISLITDVTKPIVLPILSSYCPHEWKTYSQNYVYDLPLENQRSWFVLHDRKANEMINKTDFLNNPQELFDKPRGIPRGPEKILFHLN
jgi:hypothetical protein